VSQRRKTPGVKQQGDAPFIAAAAALIAGAKFRLNK
jgi:hypothetical protein